MFEEKEILKSFVAETKKTVARGKEKKNLQKLEEKETPAEQRMRWAGASKARGAERQRRGK